MQETKVEFREEEKEEIKEALKVQQSPHVYKRLMALKLRAEDEIGSREIGKLVNLHVTSVNRIITRYKEQGIESIVGKRHNHGNRYMSYEEEEAFLETFRERAQAGQIIEVTEIYKAYKVAVGHEVTRNAIYYLLRKHKWRKVMPRSKHPKRASEAEIETYKKNLSLRPKETPTTRESTGNVSRRGWIWTNQ